MDTTRNKKTGSFDKMGFEIPKQNQKAHRNESDNPHGRNQHERVEETSQNKMVSTLKHTHEATNKPCDNSGKVEQKIGER